MALTEEFYNYLSGYNLKELDLSHYSMDLQESDINRLAIILKGHDFIRKIKWPPCVSSEAIKLFTQILTKNKEYRSVRNPALMNFPFFNIKDTRLQAIEKSKDLIVEHAERRIELYFYTLVYYYGQQYRIAIQDTARGSRQKVHGIKLFYHTEACHSAIISNPCGKPLWRRSDGLGYIDATIIWDEDNHFINVLSTTTELPTEVNDFDIILEGKIKTPSVWRKYALDLLNAVSYKQIHPVDALRDFFMMMTNFFNSLDINNAPREKQLIYNYQLEGTFTGKWDPNNTTTFTNYCCRLLRLEPNEYHRVVDLEFIQEKFQLLSEEIFRGRAQPGMR
jgi:hypothetical protein